MSQSVQQLTNNFVIVSVALIGCLVLALIFSTPTTARASDRNLMTTFTVNHPFEVPGMTLQPNTRYTIRLYDSRSTQTVVQVLNADQNKLLTQFVALADERFEPADKTTFTFIETEPGYPTPIKEWFYPGRKTGLEFVYPKEQALEIARHAKEPVLTAESTGGGTQSGNGAPPGGGSPGLPTLPVETREAGSSLVDLHKLSTVRVEAVPLGAEVPTTAAAELPTSEAKPTLVPEPPNAPTAEELAQQQSAAAAIADNKSAEIQKPGSPPAPPNTVETTRPELFKTRDLPLIAVLGTVFLGAGLGMTAMSRNRQRPTLPARKSCRYSGCKGGCNG